MAEQGKGYRALTRLTDVRGTVVAQPGETCERLPADTRWDLFVASGLIEAVAAAPVAPPAPVQQQPTPEASIAMPDEPADEPSDR